MSIQTRFPASAPTLVRTLLATTLATTLHGAAWAQGELDYQGICAHAIKDQTAQGCLEAASTPTLGRLFPLSNAFNVALDGKVAMGMTSPNCRLHVNAALGEDLFRVQRNLATRFFIDADGEVGVGGFFDPLTELHVLGHSISVNEASSLARGLEGYASSDASSSSNFGIIGFVEGPFATAVRGRSLSTTGDGNGVVGDALAPGGRGVVGLHSSSNGTAAGVEGSTASTASGAHGVLGIVTPSSPGSISAGVRGVSNGTGGLGIGVYGSQNGSGWGVFGLVDGSGIGVRGSAPSSGVAVFAQGNFTATGTKSFVQPHPTDASKEIAFVCLEGNESGTYCRGEGEISGGVAVIQVPEDFRLVSEPTGLTIQTTAIGAPARIWIESINLDTVVVRADMDVDFHYFLNGVRRGFGEHQTIRENLAFRPQQGSNDVGQDLPQAARELLVQNGILNPDYTVNLDTVAQMGWDVPVERPKVRATQVDDALPTAVPMKLEER